MKSAMLGLIISAGLIAAAATVTAGPATPEATPAGRTGLPQVNWQLMEAALAEGTVHTPDDRSLYTIQFLPDGRVAARADCNQVGGSYEVDGDSLALSELTTTLVGCPAGSLGADYAAWLERITSFELADESLVLVLDDGGRLRFVPALEGVAWEWQRFQGGNDAVVTPEHAEDYVITFQSDGRVDVRADCNTGSGRFSVDGTTITIDAIALTRMACGADSLESEFARNLTEATSFTFADGQLALALPMDAGVLLFAAHAILDEPAAPVDEGTPTTG